MFDHSNWPIKQPNTTALILSKQISCHYAQICTLVGENLYFLLFQFVNSCYEPLKVEQMNGCCQIVGPIVSTISQLGLRRVFVPRPNHEGRVV